MATTDMTNSALAARPAHAENKKFIMKSGTITLPATAAAADIFKLLPIKAGWLVKSTKVKMVTAAVGTTLTGDIGITGGTTNGFDAAFSLKGAAGTVTMSTPSDTYPAAGGYYASADTTLDLVLNTVTAITGGAAFVVYMEVEDLN